MGPLLFLKQFAKQNPKSAGVLFAGVACFAAVAVISRFNIDLKSEIPSALYVIGVGICLMVATYIANDKIILRVLSWFVLGITVIWVVGFSASRIFPTSLALTCVVRFWDTCGDLPVTFASHAEGKERIPDLSASPSQVKAIQEALCLSPSELTGIFDQRTSEAIISWRSARTSAPSNDPLSARELAELTGAKPCDRVEYRNGFERFAFPSAEKIKALQFALARSLGEAGVISRSESGSFDPGTREAIRAVQRFKGLPVSGVLTRSFVDTLAQ